MRMPPPSADWLARLAALWTQFDATPPKDFLAAMQSLVAELAAGHPRGQYELGSANDSIGNEARALPLYEAALAAGLDSTLHRQATIQYASTLRNLGRAEQGLALLIVERARISDALDDAITVFEALMLSDLGRDREALANTLTALAAHLPRYQRSTLNYAKALRD